MQKLAKGEGIQGAKMDGFGREEKII